MRTVRPPENLRFTGFFSPMLPSASKGYLDAYIPASSASRAYFTGIMPAFYQEVKTLNIIEKELASIKRGIIIHQVNCKNSMSKGLAKSLYEAHPEIKSEYHRAFVCYEPEQLFGKYQLVRLSENLIVMNSFSQFGFRSKAGDKAKYTDEAALKRNLGSLAKLGLKMNLPVYVPDKIGCSEGGNWPEIKEFLETLKPDIILMKSPEISK